MADQSSPGPEERADTLAPEERDRLGTLAKALALIERLCRFSIAISLTAALLIPLLLWIATPEVDRWFPGLVPALAGGEAMAVAALGLLVLLLLSGGVLLMVVCFRFAGRLNGGGAVVKHELHLLLMGAIPSLILGAAGVWLVLSITALLGPLYTLLWTVVCLGAVTLPSAVVWVLTQLRDVLDVTLARPFESGSPAEAEWIEIQARWLTKSAAPPDS